MSGQAASCTTPLAPTSKNIQEPGNTRSPLKGAFPTAQPPSPCLGSGLWGQPERGGARGQGLSIAQGPQGVSDKPSVRQSPFGGPVPVCSQGRYWQVGSFRSAAL